MKIIENRRGIHGLLLVAWAVLLVAALPVLAQQQERITFCHAAGQDDTTQFVTLTLPYNAVFGQAGHFNEDGTPAAGHEHDYLGPCEEDPSTPTTTTTTQGSTTSTTTSIPTTTTTPPTTTSPTTSTIQTTTSTIITIPSTTSGTPPSDPPVTTIPAVKPAIEELPYTGVPAWVLAAVAMTMVSTGGLLVRLNRA